MFGLNQKEMLEKMQQSLVDSKAKLAKIRVFGEAGGGLVRIELDGNRKLTSLEITADLKLIEKEELKDFLAIALEKALDKAEEINQTEVSSSALQFLPGF
jgi:DNA-binding YbaB/EbfC family protein